MDLYYTRTQRNTKRKKEIDKRLNHSVTHKRTHKHAHAYFGSQLENCLEKEKDGNEWKWKTKINV